MNEAVRKEPGGEALLALAPCGHPKWKLRLLGLLPANTADLCLRPMQGHLFLPLSTSKRCRVKKKKNLGLVSSVAL